MPFINSIDTDSTGFITLENIFLSLIDSMSGTPSQASNNVPSFDIVNGPTATSVVFEAKGVDPIWVDSTNLPIGDAGLTPGDPTNAPDSFQLDNVGFAINQNWRVALLIDAGKLYMLWGGPAQLDDGGLWLGDIPNTLSEVQNTILIDGGALGRDGTEEPLPRQKYPWRYMISLANRGFALMLWAEGHENTVLQSQATGSAASYTGYQYSKVICIQRPTNTVGGDVKDTPKAPVFCVYSDLVATNNAAGTFNNITQQTASRIPGFKFSIVRDNESNNSVKPGNPSMNNPSNQLLYTFNYEWHQPSMLDSFNHVIKFPFGMSTVRHIYLEEMDLLGLVFAGSFPFDQEATLNLFSTAEERIYHAGPGNVQTVPLQFNISTDGDTNLETKQGQHQSRAVIVSQGDQSALPGSDILDNFNDYINDKDQNAYLAP